MTFDDIAIDDHRVARAKLVGDAFAVLNRAHVGAVLHRNVGVQALADMCGPGLTATAVRIAKHGIARCLCDTAACGKEHRSKQRY